MEEQTSQWARLGEWLACTRRFPNDTDVCEALNPIGGGGDESGPSGRDALGAGFGVFLILCGLVAALANALVLIVVLRHLQYRNGLFLIITNFALIDEFKAMCAIYMGSVMLMAGEGELLLFKMLQSSVFIMYFGNLCSVFNLILATVNEFLYIKAPLKYALWVTRRRVGVAIGLSWVAALLFSLSRALHSGAAAKGGILVRRNSSDGEPRLLVRTYSRDSSPADVYSLVLLASLLLCVFVVGTVYANLYNTIRRSQSFRRTMKTSPFSLLPMAAVHQTNGSIRLIRKLRRGSAAPSNGAGKSPAPSRTPSARPPAADSRGFKELKCVVVILTVSGLNFIYLMIYFCIQVLHVISVTNGITRARLHERYLINFSLRALFVLHASLNPLILFRIQSFRSAFQQMFRRCRRRRGTEEIPLASGRRRRRRSTASDLCPSPQLSRLVATPV